MNKILLAAISGLLLVTVAFEVVSQQPGVDTPFPSAQIDALLALSPGERREQIRKLAPAERRGLWLQLKQAQYQQRDAKPAPRGAYKSGGLAKKLPNAVFGSKQNAQNISLPQAVGTITYDDGVITNSFGGGAIIGNRFNTHTGIPVLASGTVNTVQAVVVQGPAFTTSSAGFVLLGPQTGGGGAFAIFSTFTGGLTAATETVTFTGIGANYTGSSFFVLFGDFANSYVPAFGAGSNLGQGFHGVVGYTGGMGPNITSTFDFGNALNGLVRAGGNILPVELMQYEID